MKKTEKQLSVNELRRLLTTVVDHRHSVGFRYRRMGEMWYPNFLRIVKVTERGVMLNDETSNKLISMPDLASVIQFELDASLYHYEPHYHYTVTAEQP